MGHKFTVLDISCLFLYAHMVSTFAPTSQRLHIMLLASLCPWLLCGCVLNYLECGRTGIFGSCTWILAHHASNILNDRRACVDEASPGEFWSLMFDTRRLPTCFPPYLLAFPWAVYAIPFPPSLSTRAIVGLWLQTSYRVWSGVSLWFWVAFPQWLEMLLEILSDDFAFVPSFFYFFKSKGLVPR